MMQTFQPQDRHLAEGTPTNKVLGSQEKMRKDVFRTPALLLPLCIMPVVHSWGALGLLPESNLGENWMLTSSIPDM